MRTLTIKTDYLMDQCWLCNSFVDNISYFAVVIGNLNCLVHRTYLAAHSIGIYVIQPVDLSI